MRRRIGHTSDEDASSSFTGTRVQGSMDMKRGDHEAVVTEYTRELRRREKKRGQEHIWDWRCSVSVFGAVAIWCMITFVVVHMIGESQKRSAERDGFVTGEMLARGELIPRNPQTAASARDALQSELPAGCLGAHCRQEGGTEEFGSVLGTHNGVVAFGNCYHSTCISMLENSVDVPISPATAQRLRDASQRVSGGDSAPRVTEKSGRFARKIASGMMWQCVEYARRYWMLAGSPEPAYFGDVDGAADIWELNEAYLLDDTPVPMLKYENGRPRERGGNAPRIGDLVLYDRDDRFVPYGHVAVVVAIEWPPSEDDDARGKVYLAEQNWHNVPWPGPDQNFSRHVSLRVEVDSAGERTYTMEDHFIPIKGWVRHGRV